MTMSTCHVNICCPSRQPQLGEGTPSCASDGRPRNGASRCWYPFLSSFSTGLRCMRLWVTIATPWGSHCRYESPNLKISNYLSTGNVISLITCHSWVQSCSSPAAQLPDLDFYDSVEAWIVRTTPLSRELLVVELRAKTRSYRVSTITTMVTGR
jgi:hypothetical protein